MSDRRKAKAEDGVEGLAISNRPLTGEEISRGVVHAAHVPCCWCSTCTPKPIDRS